MIQLTAPSFDAWEAFMRGDEVPGAPDELLRTWSRSRQRGATAVGTPFVAGNDLEERRSRQDQLRYHALPVLEELSELLSLSGYVGVLADAHGVILDRRGGGSFLDAAHHAQLVEGANWSEGARGTNAIGTALLEGTDVAVYGCAHLQAANHELVCYSRPIHDPRGQLSGVLDLTSHAGAAAPLAAAAVSAAARRIEERWALDAGRSLRVVEAVVNRGTDPMALIDLSGRVRLTNRAMQALAGHHVANVQQLTGMTLDVLSRALQRGSGRTRGEGILRADRSLALEWVQDERGEPIAALLVAPSNVSTPAQPAAAPPDPFASLIGDDDGFRAIVGQAEQLAKTDIGVMLLAETGTGKELLARAIHGASPRAARPFVTVNCAGFTESLLQSELFGYADGAFTGAVDGGREGLVEKANRGTLFLDEVADLPPSAQAALLRFLENGTFHRVGDATPRTSEVRLIAATCRDLREAVANGAFRRDLFYRLKGATLTLPPLRQRDDTIHLAEQMLGAAAGRNGMVCPRLSQQAIAAIEAYDWPGNVRELKAAMTFALAMCQEGVSIELNHLPAELREHAEDAERSETEAALAQAGGNVSEAARILGVARSTIYRRLKS